MERARCLLDNHRQNHEILSHSLRLPSELPRASTERVFISVLQERKRRYKEVKHLPKVTQQSRSRRSPEPRLSSSHVNQELCPPICCTLVKPLLAPGTLQKERVQNQSAACPVSHGQRPSWALSCGSHPRPRADASVAQGLPGSQPRGSDLALTLLRRSPPPWCSGVLVSDALLVFSLLLLGSLSLMMSYWRQKRAMTPPGDKGEESEARAPVPAPPPHSR